MTLERSFPVCSLLNHGKYLKLTQNIEGKQYKMDMFEITVAFMMDSQFEKLKSTSFEQKFNRIRKRKIVDDVPEQVAEAHSLIEKSFVCDATEKLENNITARTIANLRLPDLVSLCTTLSSCPVDYANRLVNTDNNGLNITIGGDNYYLPANCQFLWSDASNLEPLLKNDQRYDILVVDPPWENKSVKRKRLYNWVKTLDLTSLPIAKLAKPNALLAIWVTANNESHKYQLLNDLFPAWNAEYITTWHWLKVTKSGEPVCPLNSRHKKPYELLVLARMKSSSNDDLSSEELKRLPQDFVLVSVPSSIHSSKVPLDQVLKPYVLPDAKKLELFARNLTPGWTSWGNEVFKLQHEMFFEEQLVCV